MARKIVRKIAIHAVKLHSHGDTFVNAYLIDKIAFFVLQQRKKIITLNHILVETNTYMSWKKLASFQQHASFARI